MRILQLMYSGLSGVADVGFNLVSGDVDHAFEHAILFVGVVPMLQSYRDICDARQIAYRDVQSAPRKPWRSWPAIIDGLKKLRPDVLIIHGSGPSVVPALLYAKPRRVPVLLVEHHPLGLRSRMDWTFTGVGLAGGAHLVFLTEEYCDAMRARYGARLRPGSFTVIPNGIDVTEFRPAESPRNPQGPLRLGMAARFSPAKRFDLIIQAVAQLRDRAPDLDWSLSLAGDGVDLPKTRMLASNLGLDDRVAFEGMLARPELARWYQELDVYVHAAEEETLSVALLQAMATELPVIASDVRGVANLLGGDPHRGILVRSQTADAFAEALLELAAEPSGAARLAKRARAVCETQFSHTAMFRAYEKLIGVLNARGRRS